MDYLLKVKAENYTGEITKAKIKEKEKDFKLDNILTLLNEKNLDLNKIKIKYIKDNKENTECFYEINKTNELFVLDYKDVDDICEFKIKGFIKNAKISILVNYTENYIQIKSDYNDDFTFHNVENLIKKIA